MTDLTELIVGVEDMIGISNLTEETLMENLMLRYNSNLIYTYTGSILVSLNPYQLLPIYDMRAVRKYVNKRIGLLRPHIFAIADDAFRSMSEGSQNQSVIISGESGAGKTEATKLILQFLSARTNKHSQVERQILESSPILESFGNAKTVRNNNSSRFGKFMEIHFNVRDEICSAKIVQYLLEKSRIVAPAESERSYHVFYQILANDDIRNAFQLGKPTDYRYLSQSGCLKADGIDDADDFERMQSAMSTLGFNPQEQQGIFSCLAAVLNIGNINFKKTGKGEAVQVENVQVATRVAELLSCDCNTLCSSLVNRINFIKQEKFVVALNASESIINRDAFSKVIYSNLFNWLVSRINQSIDIGGNSKATIGVLDIFGFENFAINSFEQLCINYTNEKLQQHFNQHIFKLEQEEYEREKINWQQISFVDNQECIDLIEKKLGIISLLDEECKFPKGTDKTFLEKIHVNFGGKHPFYEQPRRSHTTFIIKHYAGDVSYEIEGFLEKNKDKLQEELLELLCNSSDPFVSGLFQDSFDMEQMKNLSAVSPNPKGTINQRSSLTVKGTVKSKPQLTVIAAFKESLLSLVSTLTATTPHYIRCIKPNSSKLSNNWDSELVLAQLRYAGMMETVRIRRLGYPIRLTHKDFWDRYKVIAPQAQKTSDIRQTVNGLLNSVKLAKGEWQLGLTKVFLREEQRAVLEDRRNVALTSIVIKLQKTWRMWRVRKRFLQIRKATIKFQAFTRGYLAKIHYQQQKQSTILAQSLYRMIRARRVYLGIRKQIIIIQKLVRCRQAKKVYLQLLQEKKEREEAERLERERIAAERALLEQEERERLEAEDRRREEEERMERERISKERDEAERKKFQELKEKEEAKKKQEEEALAFQNQQAALNELGYLEEINELTGMIDQTNLETSRIDAVDDSVLLEQMMNPDFFGAIPDIMLSPLEELAREFEQTIDTAESLNFSFLDAPPPPPPPGFGALPPPVLDETLLPIPLRKYSLLPPPLLENPTTVPSLPSKTLGGPPPPPPDDVVGIYKPPSTNKLPPPPPPDGVQGIYKPNTDLPPTLPPRDNDLPPPPLPRDDISFCNLPPPPDDSLPPPVKSAVPLPPVTNLPPPPLPDDSLDSTTFNDRAPKKSNMLIVTSKIDPPSILLPEERDKYNWKSFANSNFKQHKGYQKAPESYSKKPIHGSLLDLSLEHSKTAEQIFLRVFNFMKDKKPTSDPYVNPRFIIQKGLAVPELRDEIYCQICKQITNNTSANAERGWELMSYCVTSFSPSDKFLNHLASFILSSPKEHQNIAAYCLRSLRRTVQNTHRKLVPSTEEFEAISKFRPIVARIRFMDGQEKAFYIDSSTTAGEMFDAVVDKIDLKDPSGFGIFEVFNNIARKLVDSDRLVDSLAKAEQLQKSIGKTKKISFNFLFKKSIYLTVKTIFDDIVERDLIFHQTFCDIIDNSLPCPEDISIQLAALKLQIDVGNYDPNRSISDIDRYVPIQLRETKAVEEWKKDIDAAHSKLVGLNRDEAIDKYLGIAQALPLYGSAIFTDINTKEKSSNIPPKFDLAINAAGMHLISKADQAIKSFSFTDLKGIPRCTDPTFKTIEFAFKTGVLLTMETEGEGGRISGLIKEYTDALRNSASYAIALADYHVDDSSLLSFKKGDIIRIKDRSDDIWYSGELNGRVGSFPANLVEIIVTSGDTTPQASSVTTLDLPPPPPNLPPPPPSNFRAPSLSSFPPPPITNLPPPPEDVIKSENFDHDLPSAISNEELNLAQFGTIRLKGTIAPSKKGALNKRSMKLHFDKQPIKSSILELPSSLDSVAKQTFLIIMKYMKDYPYKGKDYKLIQELVQLGVDNIPMRDEIYCQICKQTTNNPRRESILKGWQLLLFCVGAFAPSKDFLNYLQKFIGDMATTVKDYELAEYANISLQRLTLTLQKGSRKYAPSELEIENILAKRPIVSRIFLLDSTTKAIYISSSDTVNDAILQLNSKFDVHSDNNLGFGLFEVNQTGETSILPLPESNYVCDCLAEWELKGQGKTEETFKFLFKRKVHLTDYESDITLSATNAVVFNLIFFQILYEVKNGNLPCNSSQYAFFAALQLQLKFSDFNAFKTFDKKSLVSYIPKHLKDSITLDEFSELVFTEYTNLKGWSPQHCKEALIRKVGTHPLYGSSIFTTSAKKKSTNLGKVWLVINKKGVGYCDLFSSEFKEVWDYSAISDAGYSAKDGFWIKTGSLMKPEKLTFVGNEAPYILDVFSIYRDNFDKFSFSKY